MADTVLSYTIAEAKVNEYVADYVYIHANTEAEENGDPKYTDKQWVREHILRSVKLQIVRGKNKKAQDDLVANNANSVT